MSRLEATITPSRLSAVDDGRAVRLAGVVFFAEAALFMLAIMLAGAMAEDYDLRAGAISDFGVLPETATLFNVSLIAVGLLNIAGALLLHRWHASFWITGLFLLAGIGAIGAGAFDLDAAPDIHGLSALLAFVAFSLQPAVLATRFAGAMRALAILAATTALVFVVIMIIGDSGNTAVFGSIGHGGTERMIVYPTMLWMMVFGGYLLGFARKR